MSSVTGNPVIARFKFKPDRAAEFCEGDAIIAEQLLEDVDDVIAFCEEFGDALDDVHCLVDGKVINLSDVPSEE